MSENLASILEGFARHLAAQGIGPGDRVAILIPNRWSLVVAFLDVFKVAATAAPLSSELKQEEVDELLAALRPGALIGGVKTEEGSWVTPEYTTSVWEKFSALSC